MKSEQGIVSPYTGAVKKWISSFKIPQRLSPNEPYRLQCYTLKNDEYFIGVGQTLEIQNSVGAIGKILDDFSLYPEIFEDLLVAEMRSRSGNAWTVFTEIHIPIPFIPNERNESLYWLEQDDPSRRIYRYQLKNSNHLKANDGAIVLEKIKDHLTAYSEVDFYNADWGIAKTFGKIKIWKDGLAGVLQSDLAVKMKAENPDWTNERILEASKKQSGAVDVERCLKSATPFPFLNNELVSRPRS